MKPFVVTLAALLLVAVGTSLCMDGKPPSDQDVPVPFPAGHRPLDRNVTAPTKKKREPDEPMHPKVEEYFQKPHGHNTGHHFKRDEKYKPRHPKTFPRQKRHRHHDVLEDSLQTMVDGHEERREAAQKEREEEYKVVKNHLDIDYLKEKHAREEAKLREKEEKELNDLHEKHHTYGYSFFWYAPLEFCDEVNEGEIAAMIDDVEIPTEDEIRVAIMNKFGKRRPKGDRPDPDLNVSEDECQEFLTELTQKYKLDYTPVKKIINELLDTIWKYYHYKPRDDEEYTDFSKRIMRDQGELSKLAHNSEQALRTLSKFEAVINEGDLTRHPIYDFAPISRKDLDDCRYILSEFTRRESSHSTYRVTHHLAQDIREVCEHGHERKQLTD